MFLFSLKFSPETSMCSLFEHLGVLVNKSLLAFHVAETEDSQVV